MRAFLVEAPSSASAVPATSWATQVASTPDGVTDEWVAEVVAGRDLASLSAEAEMRTGNGIVRGRGASVLRVGVSAAAPLRASRIARVSCRLGPADKLNTVGLSPSKLGLFHLMPGRTGESDRSSFASRTVLVMEESTPGRSKRGSGLTSSLQRPSLPRGVLLSSPIVKRPGHMAPLPP